MTHRSVVTFSTRARAARSARVWVFASLIAVAALASPASATVTTSNFSFSMADNGAGVRSNVSIDFDVNPSPDTDDIKDLVVDLPVGMIGDVQNVAKCSESQLTSDNCPSTSRVGTAESWVTALILGLNPSGDIYAMPAQGTEAARLGIVLRPGIVAGKTFLRGSITLREGDYALRTTLEPLPRNATGVPLLGTLGMRIDGMRMVLFGQTSNGTKFLSSPTSCGPATARLTVNGYDSSSRYHTNTATDTPTNCASVPFTPTVSVSASPSTPDTGAATTIGVAFAPTVTPRVQSQLRHVRIDLPPGLDINPGAAGAGLEACPAATIGLTTTARVTGCPATSVVGTATINSPQVGTLSGNVYLGTAANANQLMRLFIVAERGTAASDVRIKLAGEVAVDPLTGRVTTKLTDLPQVPFSSMALTLRGGPNALMRTPRACGTSALTTILSPWSGTAAAAPRANLVTAGCADTAPFAPGVAIAASPTTAGASTAVTLTLTRPDGDARLHRARISLPAGLMGRLTDVPMCPLHEARAATCSDDSKVGTAMATAGAGAGPLALPGTLHLTPPIGDGLAGLVLIVDAKVGPLNLGKVTAMMEMKLRAGGEGIDVVTEPLPQRVAGLPLDLRTVEMTIDRPGFLLNPTSCFPSALRADIESDTGSTASMPAAFAATGCDTLPFDTTMNLTMDDELGFNGHPAISATLAAPIGGANTQSVTMLLPDGVAPDTERLGVACPAAKAQADACPAASKIGEARAMTRALPTALSGGVYLVTVPGALLPELLVRLSGPAQIELRGTINFVKNRMQVSFPSIPDVPIETFALALAGGTRGVVITSEDLCSTSPTIDLTLTGHSGATRSRAVAPTLTGCTEDSGAAPNVTVSLRGARGGTPILRISARANTPLRTITVKLPAGFVVDAQAIRRSTITGAKRVSIRRAARGLRVEFGGKGATRVGVSTLRGAITVTNSARKARRHSLDVQSTSTKGRTNAARIDVRSP